MSDDALWRHLRDDDQFRLNEPVLVPSSTALSGFTRARVIGAAGDALRSRDKIWFLWLESNGGRFFLDDRYVVPLSVIDRLAELVTDARRRVIQ